MAHENVDPAITIPEFFAGRSVFITGATGFLGKVLIEKLLWSCPNIKEIFLLMRPKKGKSIDDRLRHMLNLEVFDRLRKDKPSSLEKLIPVSGDVAQEGLGLPPVERRVIIERCSVIFHVAASVRFDDSLKDAVFMNLRSTRDVCILAGGMKKLVSLVHVSSTYTQADKPEVKEIIYPTDVDWKKTIKIAETVDEDTLKILTAKYLGTMPNTYTFTKRLAEQVIVDYSELLPCVIVRPSIVISAVREPLRGWLDNFNGPVGMMVGGGKGVLRVLYVDPHVTADYIPVDVAIKVLISAAWRRGLKTITQDSSTHVYNCAAGSIKSITTSEVVNMGLKFTKNTPLEGIMWHPATMITQNRVTYYVLMILLHLIPALIIDMILKLSGIRPMLLRLQRKVYITNCSLSFFVMNEWKFRNQKALDLLVQLMESDRQDFGFDYFNFDITPYFKDCLIGAKVYLLHEDLKNMDKARVHYNRMHWIHRIFKVWLIIFVTWILYSTGILSNIFEGSTSVVNKLMFEEI